MKKIFLAFFLFVTVHVYGQNINIHIYSTYDIDTFYLKAFEGKYDIVAGNQVLFSLQPLEEAQFIIKRDKVRITGKRHNVTTDKHIIVRSSQNACYFQLRFPREKIPTRTYDTDLYVSSKKSKFELINDVNFEKYIAGVVEAEGGPRAPLEYYKAQAILCRTYSAKYYKKHLEKDGYNLCDGVHCQAYKGRCKYNLDILDAALQTAGLVIVDSSRNLISATFYANSGGQTANSEDVWLNALPYLRSKVDTFSLGMRGSKWTKEIPLSKWEKYLKSKGFSFEPYEPYLSYRLDSTIIDSFRVDTFRVVAKSVYDTVSCIDYETMEVLTKFEPKETLDTIYGVRDTAFFEPIVKVDTVYNKRSAKHYPIDYTFKQPQRKVYYSFRGNDSSLKLTHIRSNWGLRSTFFDTYVKGDKLVFEGRGYGHGVGLSQEGAMKMADYKYSYDQIIKFYFKGVQIMSVRALNFFQVE